MHKTIRGPLMGLLGVWLTACGDSTGMGGGASGKADVCAPPSLVDDAGARPATIPALRLWEPGSGGWRYTPSTRIVVDGAALQPVAGLLADDLLEQTGRRPLIVSGTAREGDIALSRGLCDARLGTEGYGLRSGALLEIQAREPAGVFYGTRTLLQLLAQGEELPAGHALDWPRYSERGLMVDIGRKHFSIDWLRRHVRELAWLKMNVLHLHFSESLGFRIQSERHPEIVSEQHLSKSEVRELVAFAGRHHITVIPEIGMPGHMGAALAPHPEWQLPGQPTLLDVTNPDARRFARELVEEFLPLFPGPYWHTGGDEYLPFYDYARHPELQAYAREHYGPAANGKDAIHGFTNEIAALVQAHGKTPRAWHDDMNGGSAVTLSPDIVAEWWTNFSPLGDFFAVPSPQALLDRGHHITNVGWTPTYYVVGGAAGFPAGLPPRPSVSWAYENWEVHRFYGPLGLGSVQLPPQTVAADEPRHLGSKLMLWCDTPDAETEDEIAAGIAPRLRVVAQKTWDSAPLVAGHAAFEDIAQAIGPAP